MKTLYRCNACGYALGCGSDYNQMIEFWVDDDGEVIPDMERPS